MCEQCMTDCITWPDLLPGWALIRAQKDGRLMKAGDWGLVESNDPAVVFKTAPMADPLAGMSDEEIDRLAQDSEQWQAHINYFKAVDGFRRELTMPPRAGKRLVDASEAVGFDDRSDGFFDAWLFDRMGRRVAAEPNGIPKTEGR